MTDLAVLSSDGEFGPTDFRTEGNLSARIHELEPKAKELEMLRAKLHRMQALYGVPNCFLANTALYFSYAPSMREVGLARTTS